MKSIKKVIARIGLGGAMFTPVLASAQFGEINNFFGKITTFINNTLIPLIFTIALLVFIWGMYESFIQGGKNPDKQKEGRQLMIYAVVAFVLMVSIWGIVNALASGLGFSGQNIQNIPSVPTR